MSHQSHGRYFFAPCTRALEAYWLCRSLAGSGVSDDPLLEYQATYLKDDMGHACWSGEHIPVVIVASILWLAYAVAFPLTLAWVIAKDKAASKTADADDANNVHANGASSWYWHSTRPLVEKFWLPLVAHLQPQVRSSASAILPLVVMCLTPEHKLANARWVAALVVLPHRVLPQAVDQVRCFPHSRVGLHKDS